MLKYVFLTGAAMISVPVLAQTAPMDQAAPTATTPPAGDPAMTTTDTMSSTAQPAPAQQPATAAVEPAASNQVAQVIEADFAKYDKDSNGNLSKTEFGSWMVALKTASDPTTKAETAETKTWVGQAFAQADTDKSTSITKPELTKFLAQGAG